MNGVRMRRLWLAYLLLHLAVRLLLSSTRSKLRDTVLQEPGAVTGRENSISECPICP